MARKISSTVGHVRRARRSVADSSAVRSQAVRYAIVLATSEALLQSVQASLRVWDSSSAAVRLVLSLLSFPRFRLPAVAIPGLHRLPPALQQRSLWPRITAPLKPFQTWLHNGSSIRSSIPTRQLGLISCCARPAWETLNSLMPITILRVSYLVIRKNIPGTGRLRKGAKGPYSCGVLRLSAYPRQNHRQLVAHFRASGAVAECRERARNLATRWLRALDSKFDTHHDARLMVGLSVIRKCDPQNWPVEKKRQKYPPFAQISVSLVTSGRTAANWWRNSALLLGVW